jgi:hypothetical protein
MLVLPHGQAATATIDEVTDAAVVLWCLQGSCFQRKGPAGTFDYWVKLPSPALVNGNCYCYALDMFKGGKHMIAAGAGQQQQHYAKGVRATLQLGCGVFGHTQKVVCSPGSSKSTGAAVGSSSQQVAVLLAGNKN